MDKHIIIRHSGTFYDIRCSDIMYITFSRDYVINFKMRLKDSYFQFDMKRPDDLDEHMMNKTYSHNRELYVRISKFVYESSDPYMEVDFSKEFNEIVSESKQNVD